VSSQNGAIPASVQRQRILLISECFLFVISTFEMLISRIFLSGVEWVMLNVKYPQVTTNLNKAILADNNLWIMFARKGSNQELICSVHHRSTLILWFYGADQEHLTQNSIKLFL
jgi:hypothetical protein